MFMISRPGLFNMTVMIHSVLYPLAQVFLMLQNDYSPREAKKKNFFKGVKGLQMEKGTLVKQTVLYNMSCKVKILTKIYIFIVEKCIIL